MKSGEFYRHDGEWGIENSTGMMGKGDRGFLKTSWGMKSGEFYRHDGEWGIENSTGMMGNGD